MDMCAWGLKPFHGRFVGNQDLSVSSASFFASDVSNLFVKFLEISVDRVPLIVVEVDDRLLDTAMVVSSP